jgi:hypothetical protein
MSCIVARTGQHGERAADRGTSIEADDVEGQAGERGRPAAVMHG